MSPLPSLQVVLYLVIVILVASSIVRFPSAAAAAPAIVLSSLSTYAVASTPNSTYIICALAYPKNKFSGDDYTLNCTTLVPGGPHITYPSIKSAYYSGIAAGDDFLCGVSTFENETISPTSIMRWWDIPRLNSTEKQRVKKLYDGDPIVGLGAGGSHVCGLIDEKITCWRWLGFTKPSSENFSAIAVGREFVCGLLKDSGKVRCFGNDMGVVGQQPTGGGYVMIAASSCRACVVFKGTRKLQCWGAGASGNADELQSEVAGLALGERNRTCIIDINGTATCWGEQGFDLPDHLKTQKFMSVTASSEVFCGVLKLNLSLVCWGSSRGLQDGSHRVVFDRVLPGPCQPDGKTTCPCILAGSDEWCPGEAVICERCDNDAYEDPRASPLFPPQSTPTNHTGGGSAGTGGGKDNNKLVYLLVGSIGAGVALVALTAVVLFTFYDRRRSRSQVHDSGRLDDFPSALAQLENGRPRLTAPPAAVAEYSFEVLRAITETFSERNKIGYGSFGSVYRAALPDGRQVAIKRADPPSSSPPTPATPRAAAVAANNKENKEQAFLCEVALLSRVNHKNLVRLLGYCREGPELVLVYEYMANGTLRDHLHRLPYSPLVGSWASRLRVALDAARGIEYLHRYAVPPIIHRDIKPSNILLDDGCTAKVADFGLCCAAPECNKCDCDGYYGGKRTDGVDTESYSASAVPTAGTVGYMDPEYYRLQYLTAKSDVYSFGVVLLELLTGRKAIHRPSDEEGDTEPCNVVDFAVPHIEQGEIQRVFDPKLPPPRPCEIEAVQQVGDLAAECVRREGRNRPDMAYVVAELQMAVDLSTAPPPSLLSRSMTAHSV